MCKRTVNEHQLRVFTALPELGGVSVTQNQQLRAEVPPARLQEMLRAPGTRLSELLKLKKVTALKFSSILGMTTCSAWFTSLISQSIAFLNPYKHQQGKRKICICVSNKFKNQGIPLKG